MIIKVSLSHHSAGVTDVYFERYITLKLLDNLPHCGKLAKGGLFCIVLDLPLHSQFCSLCKSTAHNRSPH